jgi:GH35 family endo-1,4-beta-xylanase
MADRIHPAMHTMKPPLHSPIRCQVPGHAQRRKLARRDQRVLVDRELGYSPLHESTGRFVACGTTNPPVDAHAPRLPSASARVGGRCAESVTRVRQNAQLRGRARFLGHVKRFAALPAVVALAAAVAAIALGAAAAPAQARPAFGVVNQGILGDSDFARMEHGGVRTLRFLIRWEVVEPQPGQYDWSSIDAVVGGAQAHGIRLLPFVYGSPTWINQDENHAPLDTPGEQAAWQGLLSALASRYGPGGTYFAGGPEWPIRRWQIWNEPNFSAYWEPPQSAQAYGELVKLSASALRSVDPNAKIVLAGVAAVHDGVPWAGFLKELLAVPGIRRSFDFVGFHPYSQDLRMLRSQLDRMRRILARAGYGHAPLAVTEIGWASDGERPRPLVVGPQMQAELLRRSFAVMSRPATGWRIRDVEWYAWQDSRAVEDQCVFCPYAGLFDSAGEPKPAWGAFRRAVSG